VGRARLGIMSREMYHKRWPFGSEKRRCRRKTCRGGYTITYSVSKVLTEDRLRDRKKPGSMTCGAYLTRDVGLDASHIPHRVRGRRNDHR